MEYLLMSEALNYINESDLFKNDKKPYHWLYRRIKDGTIKKVNTGTSNRKIFKIEKVELDRFINNIKKGE